MTALLIKSEERIAPHVVLESAIRLGWCLEVSVSLYYALYLYTL